MACADGSATDNQSLTWVNHRDFSFLDFLVFVDDMEVLGLSFPQRDESYSDCGWRGMKADDLGLTGVSVADLVEDDMI